MDRRDGIAAAMEQGGAVVTVGAWGLVTWLDDHYRAVMAFCAIVGAIVSFGGFLLGWYYKHKRFQNGLQDECEDGK